MNYKGDPRLEKDLVDLPGELEEAEPEHQASKLVKMIQDKVRGQTKGGESEPSS